MITYLVHLRATLDALQPGAFNAALALLIFAALWALRKVKPAFFATLPETFQAWPALVSGAVIAALSGGGDLVAVLGSALGGLVSGVLAVGVHRVGKESALPYGTARKLPFTAGLVFILAGCASQLQQAQCRVGAERTVAVAHTLCVTYQTHKHPEDGIAVAAEKFCSTAEQLSPFAEAACDVAAAVDPPESADAGAE